MKRSLLFLICVLLCAALPVSAQELSAEPTATPEISLVQPAEAATDPTEDPDITISRPTATPEITLVQPTPAPTAAVIIVNPNLGTVSGDGVISGRGNNTVKLWDRSLYENQPKSVTLANAKEMFQTGMEVPKPLLDRPIVEGWDDLKPGYACEAILNRPYYFQQMKFGEEFTLDITFRNVGTQTWDFNIDVMQYTGDRLEKNGKYIYDLGKDFKDSGNMNDRIVRPGESIRITIPMRAPTEKYHDDNKYYSAYTLVRNWDQYGWDALHSGDWKNDGGGGMFCPVYFYIYVP